MPESDTLWSTTAHDGTCQVAFLPAGLYRVMARHDELGRGDRPIEIAPVAEVEIEVRLRR